MTDHTDYAPPQRPVETKGVRFARRFGRSAAIIYLAIVTLFLASVLVCVSVWAWGRLNPPPPQPVPVVPMVPKDMGP
jgi:hypothetical protein